MSEAPLTIPLTLQPNIQHWSTNDVETFLVANKYEYRLGDEHISAIQGADIDGRALISLEKQDLRDCGIPIGPVVRIVELINELKREKGILKLVHSEPGSITDNHWFRHWQQLDVNTALLALPPSSAAVIANFSVEQGKRPILNGRPAYHCGPPVGLFHPVFDSFCSAIISTQPLLANAAMDMDMQDGLTIYMRVVQFFSTCADIYKTEDDRLKAINNHLTKFLEAPFIVVQETGVKSSGVIVQPCLAYKAYPAILEIKNEIGTGNADPVNQGGLAYRKYWAAPSQDIFRNISYCPSIILAFAGPWLCVLGGIYHTKAVIQPLTDYIWLGGNQFNEDRLHFVVRLFLALRAAISTLMTYYSTLFTREEPKTEGFLYIRNCCLGAFTYENHLAPNSTKPIYKVRLDGTNKSLVIKFVSSYNASAHRLLARHQLAPELYYAGTEHPLRTLYGSRYMVVMDFFDGEVWLDTSDSLGYHQVSLAIELLHSNDFVHGDLRRTNILIKDSKIMLTDFDWCNKQGDGRYPGYLNMDPAIGWPPGVKPGLLMTKEHDLFMLKKLDPDSIA